MPINQGEVDITIDGAVYQLRCTLGAAKEVNAILGSFGDAYAKVQRMDLFAFVVVICAGLNKSGKDAVAMEATVYTAGLQNLQSSLLEYLTLLSNGGRPPVKADSAEAAPDSKNR